MSRKRSVSSSSSSGSSSHSSKSSRSRSSSGSSASNRSKNSKRSRSNSSSKSGSSGSSRSRSTSRSTRSSRRHSKSSSRERGRSNRRYRSHSRSHGSFKKASRSVSPRRRSRSPFNAKASKIYVGRLSRNVNKEHINEIFCNYGVLKSVELPADYQHPFLTRGFAYVEYEKPEEAEKAIKYMDGGQIDGQVVNVSIAVGPRAKTRYNNNRRRQGWRSKHSPPRHLKRRRSPSPGYYRSRGPRRSISRSRSRDKDLKDSPRRRRGSS